MKKIQRATVLTLCLLFLTGIGVKAQEVPTATFTNKKNDTPDLNVVKYVENLDAAYPAPEDARFTFVVKVDGEFYRNKEYELYKLDEPGMIPENHRTDKNGSFQLKAGEKARFPYVGSGRQYEVYEERLPENFLQLTPAEGTSAIGTILPGGALVEFTNQYQQSVEPGPDPVPVTTELSVSKRISFPKDYIPSESPEFSFKVTLDNEVYSQETYETKSLDTGLITGSGTTDEEGVFTLVAGEQAVFSDIPVNVDYKVEEIPIAGWWSTNGKTSQEGATAAPAVTVNFTNANASFIVTKQLEDNSKPGKEFTFTLMQGDRSHWAGAAYYLYSTGGEWLGKKKQTDKDGKFILKPGQAAVFVGIEPGIPYHVSETKDPEYSQITPNSPQGYTDKIVQNNVEVLPFINRKEETQGFLTVTKRVTAKDGVFPENPQEFKFRISKGEESSDIGQKFEPMEKTSYQIGTGPTTQTKRTESDGTFILKAGETARFDALLAGTYQVEEITTGLSKEYTPPENVVQKGHLSMGDEEGLEFIFVNDFKVQPLSIRLVKTGWGQSTYLPGAVFRLYNDKDFKNEVKPGGAEEDFAGYRTGNDGTITIPDLQAGTYYLKEVKAPEGYRLLANPLEIVITRNGDKLEAMVNSLKPTQGRSSRAIVQDEYTVTIEIQNSKNFILPATGGEGIAFLLAAAAGIVFVLAVLWKKGKVKIKK